MGEGEAWQEDGCGWDAVEDEDLGPGHRAGAAGRGRLELQELVVGLQESGRTREQRTRGVKTAGPTSQRDRDAVGGSPLEEKMECSIWTVSLGFF